MLIKYVYMYVCTSTIACGLQLKENSYLLEVDNSPSVAILSYFLNKAIWNTDKDKKEMEIDGVWEMDIIYILLIYNDIRW